MNKAELIASIADKADLTKAQATQALKSIESAVTEALKEGNKVSIVGFGSFETATRAARVGRNPSTGAEIEIPAAVIPKFKAGKALKDSVN
ncbi:transcriptional regulator HU subunit alpha [Shewanella mangrovi]|uniref:Transcriptional regulator HU subunit alpha n=1 Tax=Shewanella mangrovi TaxID=1515746 RepID=A0A094JFL7_9GAMM|nr:HU family DNA-binding protein [Shewanella mangrovi]KFZ36814.1 transcriptional regulator HU subunit alpha [Shewanella mangrovi]